MKEIIHSPIEPLIEKYLIDNNIHYEREKSFPDLKDIFPLRFDFFITYCNVKIAIEYQGQHHFSICSYIPNHSSYELDKTMDHDLLKKIYCLKNNIILIEFIRCNKSVINRRLNHLFSSIKKISNVKSNSETQEFLDSHWG